MPSGLGRSRLACRRAIFSAALRMRLSSFSRFANVPLLRFANLQLLVGLSDH